MTKALCKSLCLTSVSDMIVDMDMVTLQYLDQVQLYV